MSSNCECTHEIVDSVISRLREEYLGILSISLRKIIVEDKEDKAITAALALTP